MSGLLVFGRLCQSTFRESFISPGFDSRSGCYGAKVSLAAKYITLLSFVLSFSRKKPEVAKNLFIFNRYSLCKSAIKCHKLMYKSPVSSQSIKNAIP